MLLVFFTLIVFIVVLIARKGVIVLLMLAFGMISVILTIHVTRTISRPKGFK